MFCIILIKVIQLCSSGPRDLCFGLEWPLIYELPVQPETPDYPFQHICSEYISLYGVEYCVIVDRFSGWYNIYMARGDTDKLIEIFTKLSQDVGVTETLTTDGGTTYVSH